ncbi:MAG: LysR family transcriptional regulator [Pseudobacteriovorax sp.]|nr:LysR family transcriptional regulator [Pseudobacteriovorax sp.]
MTLDQLKVLAAIVDTGSFRAAADKLNRAQSAVSYAIKTIEEEFDLLVFDRANYRPELTREGRTLYQRSKPLIEQADQLANLCRFMATGAELELRLALNFIAPISPLTKVLEVFSNKFPMTNLNLAVTNMREPLERLKSDEADIAISDIEEWDETLETCFWRRVTLVPVCSPSYSAAMLDAKDLSGFTQIVVSTTPNPEEGQSTGIVSGCKQWVVTTFAAKTELLTAGLGWGFLPSHHLDNHLNGNQLVQLKKLDPISRDFYICRKRGRPLGEASHFIWKQLCDSSEGRTDGGRAQC